jgi:hypothetical protein
MRLVNRSGYHTGDLRSLFERGLRAMNIPPGWSRRMVIVVTASPIRSRGCAEVSGDVVSIAISPPSRFSRRRLARLFEHEVAHWEGRHHHQMRERLLYSLGKKPNFRLQRRPGDRALSKDWATGMRLRYLGRAPDQIRALSSR